MLDRLKALRDVWLVMTTIIAGVCASMAYFTPASSFEEFRDNYQYDRAIQTRRELRREVFDCNTLIKERQEAGARLTPFEQERCAEAVDEYNSVQQTVKERWGK